MEQQKKLPLPTSSFKEMVSDNYIYVDKTDMIAELAKEKGVYFFSRPRRFGKSTLVSTFYDLFTNGLQNFKGLKIEREGLYQDEQTYKVLHFDFSDCPEQADMQSYLYTRIVDELTRNGITCDERISIPSIMLDKAICNLEQAKLVLLVDEYDTPLTTVLNSKDELAKRRSLLQSFYAIFKKRADKFRFIFITGITRYSHVSIFTALNNFYDISFSPKYGALLGYTQEEMEYYFKDHISSAALALNIKEGCDTYTYEVVRSKLEQHYKGYCFDVSGETSVYNPWSILSFLIDPTIGFAPYWMRSGSSHPALLIEYLEKKRELGIGNNVEYEYEKFLDLDATKLVSIDDLAPPLVDLTSKDFSFEAVLYQAGYLCIKSARANQILRLGIPNLEVKTAYAEIILKFLGKKISKDFALTVQDALGAKLLQKNYVYVKEVINQLLNSLSYDSLSKFNESSFRDFFKITMTFAMAKNIQSEVQNAVGRCDLIFSFEDTYFVCEFKLATHSKYVKKKLAEAKKQIKSNKYDRLYGVNKVVSLAIVAVNQPRDKDTSAVREIAAIQEV